MRLGFLLLFLASSLACAGAVPTPAPASPAPTAPPASPPSMTAGAQSAPSAALAALPPSDFTPATGRGAPDPASSGMERTTTGPWATELRVARSTDGGATFTDTGEVIAQQAGVPSAIVHDGLLWVYYNAWQNGQNFRAVAARDPATPGTWRYYKVQIAGGPIRTGDIHAVHTDDGKLRIYYTAMDTGSKRVLSAVGTDGIHFTQESGSRFDPGQGAHWSSPMVVKAGGKWLMYTVSDDKLTLVSDDGLTFTRDPSRAIPGAFFPSSAIELPTGGYRIFGATRSGVARTAFSADGKTWKVESSSYWPGGDGFAGFAENAVAAVDNALLMVCSETIGGSASTPTASPQGHAPPTGRGAPNTGTPPNRGPTGGPGAGSGTNVTPNQPGTGTRQPRQPRGAQDGPRHR